MQKRLLINLLPKFHAEIKWRAAKMGLSMKDYVIEALIEKINREEKKDG